jgi:formate hydrogenlyase subunit 3/multisubunit Na+/H+ antiporter MnhD subunit
MSLLAFIAACGIGAVTGLATRGAGWIGRAVGLAGLSVAFVAALLVGPTTRATIGEVTLAGSQYSGLFLACAAGSGLLLCAVALAAGWPDDLAPAALGSFAGLAVALTATDSGVALAAGAAAATVGALVILRTTPPGSETDGRLAEIRTIGLTAAALLLAAIAILRPSWRGPSDSPIFVLAFLGMGAALAVRSGAVPFHVPAARLGRTAEPLAQALLLVWIPAGLGIVVVGWSATTFGMRSDWLNVAISGVQVVAVATLVLGGLASLVHDELEEIAAYSIIADAGFVLLALAARTDAAAEPTRVWLLAFVAAKTGLVAWVGAVSHAFATSNVGRLRGWLRRTPLLGLALVALMLATLGWPGSVVYEARSTLIRLALPGQLQFLFAASIMLGLACVGRLLILGALAPTENVTEGGSERPRWAFDPLRPRKATVAVDPAAGSTADGSAGGAAATATSVDATEAKSIPAAKKSSGSRAAALPPAPTTAAANDVAATDNATATAAVSPAAPAASSPAAPVPAGPPDAVPASERGGAEREAAERFRRNLALTWRLNRTLEVSLVVVCGAALAAALAFGGLGASNASRFGIPLDTAAHATPTRTPRPTPSPTPRATPVPTLAPLPTTPAPSTSATPSPSPTPSGSPPPLKTSAPARNITD